MGTTVASRYWRTGRGFSLGVATALGSAGLGVPVAGAGAELEFTSGAGASTGASDVRAEPGAGAVADVRGVVSAATALVRAEPGGATSAV